MLDTVTDLIPEDFGNSLIQKYQNEWLYTVSTALMLVYGFFVWYFNIFKNYDPATDAMIQVLAWGTLILFTPPMVLSILNYALDNEGGKLHKFYAESINWYKIPTFGVFGLVLLLQT